MAKLNMNFWITKKTVQRKLGSKEDEHIISSDADLDAKIEVFKSISDTSGELSKIINQYQERICILSQEECVFGRFLKEVGKRSKTTGTIITNTGKAISYSGQQRMCVRVPLLRLHHEVEVFRFRAIRDSQETLRNMEKDRTEYRAALSWMKYASSELDPEKGLEKFRTAQSHVRVSKQNFDKASLDSIQKIDLLAAARCNMYSHALVAYMNELKQFAQKTANTYAAVSRSLLQKPKYDFLVLKDLTQEPAQEQLAGDDMEASKEPPHKPSTELITIDKDQTLFFADDYVDADTQKIHVAAVAPMEEQNQANDDEAVLIELSKLIEDGDDIHENDYLSGVGLNARNDNAASANFWSKMLTTTASRFQENYATAPGNTTATSTTSLSLNHSEVASTTKDSNEVSATPNATNLAAACAKAKKLSSWMEIFAELDPLSNPEAFDMKINGGRSNYQQT